MRVEEQDMRSFELLRLELSKLTPDPEHERWACEDLDSLAALLRNTVLPRLDEAATFLDRKNASGAKLRTDVAEQAAMLAMIYQAAGRTEHAQKMLLSAQLAQPEQGLLIELELAIAEPGTYLLLTQGRWYHRGGEFEKGDKVLIAAKQVASSSTLRDTISRLIGGSRPVGAATPTCFELEEFAMKLYGVRDRHFDGSYVATHALGTPKTPLIHLAAYRVFERGNGVYTYISREPLSTRAKLSNAVFFSLCALIVSLLIATSAI